MLPTMVMASKLKRRKGYILPGYRPSLIKPPRHTRVIRIALVVFVILLFTYTSTSANRRPRLRKRQPVVRQKMFVQPQPYDICTVNLTRLHSFNLSSTFEYSQRFVRQVPLTEKRKEELQDGNNPEEIVQGDLFPSISVIDGSAASDPTVNREAFPLSACTNSIVSLAIKEEEALNDEQDEEDDASNLLFGVASTAERLLEAKEHFSFWLANTGAHLFIACPPSPLVPALKEAYTERGIRVTIVESDEDTYLKTYFRLLLWLNDAKQSDTQWITIIDDDTFYFSLRRFITTLQKYDPEEKMYIGAPSEDAWQMMRSGSFAFGGAGITLSAPLLDTLVEYYDECKTYTKLDINDAELGGDIRIARCITRNTKVKLTVEKDLHQVDLRGDVRGVLQGPRVPINWHHYRSRIWGGMLDVLRIAKSVPFCQSDCLFQRWKFYSGHARSADDDFVDEIKTSDGFHEDGLVSALHLGHSFVRYAPHIDPEMDWYEQTWIRRPLSAYDHSLEPLRRPYVEGKERFSYMYEGGQWTEEGTFVQTYVKRARGDGGRRRKGQLDSVVELIFIQ